MRGLFLGRALDRHLGADIAREDHRHREGTDFLDRTIEDDLAVLDSAGFVRDYLELSALKHFLDTTADHKHLNDVLGHDKTTAEVISKWLYDWCKSHWPEVVAVRVCETPRTWAEYRP